MSLTEAERIAVKQERLDALEEARDMGVTEVRYRDRTVQYRSLDDLNRLIDQLNNEIAGKPRAGRARTFGVYSRKGT